MCFVHILFHFLISFLYFSEFTYTLYAMFFEREARQMLAFNDLYFKLLSRNCYILCKSLLNLLLEESFVAMGVLLTTFLTVIVSLLVTDLGAKVGQTIFFLVFLV